MAIHKQRRTSLFFIVFFISTAMIAFAFFYFLQTVKNEDNINQLHFRELDRVAKHFTISLQRLENISRYIGVYDVEQKKATPSTIKPNATAIAQHKKENYILKEANTNADLRGLTIETLESESESESESEQNNPQPIFQQPNQIRIDIGAKRIAIPADVATQLAHTSTMLSRYFLLDKNGKVLVTHLFDKKQSGVQINRFSAQLSQWLSEPAKDAKGDTKSTLPAKSLTQEWEALLAKLTQKSGFKGLETSHYNDADIAGTKYRVYISPYEFNLQDTGSSSTTFYIVGLAPQSEIRLARLYISPSIITIAVGLFLLLLGLTPFLKVRFVSNNYAFSRTDRRMLVIGTLIISCVVALLAVDYYTYDEINARIKRESEILFNSLKQNFTQEQAELKEILKQVPPPNFDHKDQCKLDKNSLAHFSERLTTSTSYVKNVFYVKPDGDLTCYWNWQGLTRKTNVKEREYFKQSNTCVTDKPITDFCRDTVFYQRLSNKLNGVLQTQIAMPAGIQHARPPFAPADPLRAPVVSAGTVIDTLNFNIMPRNFFFVVFQNESGEVLYHSDNELSLVDNFYAATANDPRVVSIAKNPAVTFEQIRLDYYGELHLATIGPLFKQQGWSLAVLYTKKSLQLMNMFSVVTAMLLLSLLMTLLLIFMHLTNFLLPWQSLVLLTKRHGHFYIGFNMYLAVLLTAYLLCFFSNQPLSIKLWLWLMCVISYVVIGFITLNRLQQSLQTALLIVLTSSFAIITWAWWKTGERGALLVPLALLLMAFVVMYRLHHNRIEDKSRTLNSRGVRNGSLANTESRKLVAFTVYLILQVGLVTLPPSLAITFNALQYFAAHAAQQESSHIKRAMAQIKGQQATQIDSFEIQRAHRDHFNASYFCQLKDTPPDLDENRLWQITEAGQKLNQYCQHGLSLSSRDGDLHSERAYPLMQTLIAEIAPSSELTLSLRAQAKQESPTGNTPLVALDLHAVLRDSLNRQFVLFLFVSSILSLAVWGLVRRILLNRFMGANLVELQLERGEGLVCESRQQDIFSDPQFSRHLLLLRPRREVIDQLTAENHDNLVFGAPLDLQSELRQLVQSQPSCTIISSTNIDLSYTQEQASAHLQSTGGLDERVKLEYLKSKIRLYAGKTNPLVMLRNLDAIALDKAFRHMALELIEYTMSFSNMRIYIIAHVSPLYRLTRQQFYPNANIDDAADATEVLRWSGIFSRFSKYSDWYPGTGRIREFPLSVYETMRREVKCWPEMDRIFVEFLQFHKAQKLHDEERRSMSFLDEFVKKPKDRNFHRFSQSLNANQRALLAQSLAHHWTVKDINSFFVEKAGAIYRYRWELCTKEERLLLFQLASGRFANPLNKDTLEHLFRRGYVVNRGKWELASDSFASFVLTAEKKADMRDWIEESKHSAWRYIRVPIFILIFTLLALIMYAATETYETILGLMTATLTLIPLLLRNVSLFKSTPSQE